MIHRQLFSADYSPKRQDISPGDVSFIETTLFANQYFQEFNAGRAGVPVLRETSCGVSGYFVELSFPFTGFAIACWDSFAAGDHA